MKQPATPAERAHMGRVAMLGCLACKDAGLYPVGQTLVHHLRRNPETGQNYGAGVRAPHKYTVPLCWGHHAVDSPMGFHRNPRAFEAQYGTELDLLKQTYRELGLPLPSEIPQ